MTFQYQLEHELYHCRKRSPLPGLAVMEVHKQLGVGRHENTIYNCQGRRMPVDISSEHFEIWPDIANIWLVGLDANTTVSSHKLISSDFFSISIILRWLSWAIVWLWDLPCPADYQLIILICGRYNNQIKNAIACLPTVAPEDHFMTIVKSYLSAWPSFIQDTKPINELQIKEI